MDNENKWEYDYSASDTSSSGTGYPNVGSSGMNTANTADSYGDTDFSQPLTQTDGGAVPPPPAEPAAPEKPQRKRRFQARRIARSVVSLLLAAAMGFVGGFAGAKLSGGNKVVMQTVEHTASDSSAALGTTTSAGSSDLTLAQVSALVSPSVVAITTEQVVYSQWSWYGQSQVQSGAGSGVIISSDGYILTCEHVVDGASSISVTIDGTDYEATVVGGDSTSDIAVIKVDATGLTPASVGDSDALTVGEAVVAVGNPLGKLSGTVTNGIISALNRSVSVQGNRMTLIQTDASISPGNSGGGLFNMAGELVGIVNAKSSSTDAEGIGFAIPINAAISVTQELIENGYVTGRPYMGVTVYKVANASTAAQLGVSSYGVYIVQMVEGGPAEKAGLEVGDRIVSIGDVEISQNSDVTTAVSAYNVGDTIEVTVARDSHILSVNLTLVEMPKETS